jgi:predicted transposase YdaD
VDNKGQILEIIETILVYKFPKLSREEIQKMLGYNDISLKETRFYQDVYAEGQQEGRQEGEAKLILRQLNRRFGVLGDDIQSSIKRLSITQLEALDEALLEFLLFV